MKYRNLGNTGYEVSRVVYGGIVSSSFLDDRVIYEDGQKKSDYYVSYAIEHGVNYFDVAPSYGNAQEMLGNSLAPYRKKVFLACKTQHRVREQAEQEMRESLRMLKTDYFDVYQLHALSTMEELETAFGPGGVMELLTYMKQQGIARKVGITAHSESVALKALEYYPFDTVLFPFNWHLNIAYKMGNDLLEAARKKGVGVLCMKSMIERSWKDDEDRYASSYPKSWCRPFDVKNESDLLMAAVRYALSLDVDTIIPPGNFDHFKFAVEHIDEMIDDPLSDADRQLLSGHLAAVSDYPFFDPK